MTAIDMLDQIEARHIAWHDSEPEGAEWSDLHGALSSTADATADELAMAWELARNDVPALVDALRAAVHVALGENTEEWVRAARGGAMIAAADVLEAIEEKLS